MNQIYDLIIIGTGPAGLFCALKINQRLKEKMNEN